MAPILGAFGATAAAGRLFGLSAEQMVHAFSLTLCQATCSADSAADPDSVIRAVRDAFAARAGVLSARLVGLGTRGSTTPFEGTAGLFELYAPGEYDLARLTEGLGVGFEGSRVSYKPWPCCRGTHAHIEATIGLVSANDLDPLEISGIRLGLEDLPVMRMLSEPIEAKRRPQTAIDAKFSIPFTVAVAAIRGDVTLDAFSEGGLEDDQVLSVVPSIECEIIAGARGAEVGFVEITTDRGRFRANTPTQVLGSPGNPLSDDALMAKFRGCAEHAPTPLEADRLERVIDSVMDPEGRSTVDDWVSLLCPSQRARTKRTWKEDDAGER
jgi:2-methylcitrate dehydratase PrpD